MRLLNFIFKLLFGMNKQEFIISQLKPYFEDPSICGYDKNDRSCQYLTKDGKMCVLGKNLINPELDGFKSKGARTILKYYGLEIIKPEVRYILTIDEWEGMQLVHDSLVTDFSLRMKMHRIDSLETTANVDLTELKNLLK